MRAVENAVGVKIPKNARILRNILHGAQFQHDHLVHFYHLHALDWVDVVSALSADPQDARLVVEFVQLSARLGDTAESRLLFLESRMEKVNFGELHCA